MRGLFWLCFGFLCPLEIGDPRLQRATTTAFRLAAGKLLSPSRRRQCIDRVRQTLGVSERRACRTLGQHRSTQRKVPRGRPDEDRLTADIIELATQYGRYGYRPVTALLNQAGWHVNHKRVERIWQREGLKVPPKQKKRSRLWLNDGSCIRLRPERPNHVWSYDFVQDRTHDGRPYRILVILDEFTATATRDTPPVRSARLVVINPSEFAGAPAECHVPPGGDAALVALTDHVVVGTCRWGHMHVRKPLRGDRAGRVSPPRTSWMRHGAPCEAASSQDVPAHPA
jgi:putative transposase